MKHAAVRGAFRQTVQRAAVGWIFVSISLVATAGEPIVLRWRLEPANVFHFKSIQSTSIDSRPEEGGGVHSSSRQEVEFHWTVLARHEDSAEMSLTIDRIHLELAGDDRVPTFEFDTAAAAPVPQAEAVTDPYSARLSAALRELIGMEVSFRLDVRGNVSDVKPPASLPTLVRTTGVVAGASLVSEEGMRNLVIQPAPPFPEGEVAPGSTWTRQTAAPMPMFGSLIRDETYTDRGLREGAPTIHEVAFEIRASLQPAPDPVLDMQLLKQNAEGAFDFDVTSGAITSYRRCESLTFAFLANGRRIERLITDRLVVERVASSDAPAVPIDAEPPPPIP